MAVLGGARNVPNNRLVLALGNPGSAAVNRYPQIGKLAVPTLMDPRSDLNCVRFGEFWLFFTEQVGTLLL